ncbi:MAG TPA: radical SAM family heme chaperone HemW [Candidatus Acidoferrales bacterium]|nr:radical SAM family heme chaperone HemW [Candidatus Acidoferrales bacterium]
MPDAPMGGRLTTPPLGVYVHLPWCVRKCPYCDFNSHARHPALIPEAQYVEALTADLRQDLALLGAPRPVHSVFFGGGTPSLFTPEAIAALITMLRRHLPLVPDVEITMEANPGTFEQARFAGYRAAGVNRLSIGIQSFNDGHLQTLGRIHSAGEAIAAVQAARELGFAHLNLDLMYGLPGQTPDEALADLAQAIALAPDHISHYQLTLEPNTPFAQRPPVLPADEAIGRMERRCRTHLARAGFRRYEVSAFARPGGACRHNLNYWTFGDYLGIGAGAHGKLTDPANGQILRTRKHSHPQRYLATAAAPERLAEQTYVPPRALTLEFLMNALRLTDGFRLALYARRTGLDPATLLSALAPALTGGLLRLQGDTLVPTRRGLALTNEILLAFMD